MMEIKPVDNSLATDFKFQQWVRGLLHDKDIRNLCITFTKADGSERTIRGTTSNELVPINKHPKRTGAVVTKETQRVFDLDKQEWRSFRWESVTQVSFSIGDENDQ